MYVNVMSAHIGETFAVRRELGIFARVGGGGQLHCSSGIKIEIPELSLRIEEQVFRIGRPVIGGDVIARDAFLFALIRNLAGRRCELSKLAFTDQDFLFSRCRVDIPQFAMLTRVVTLDERDLGAVGAPLNGFGSASGDAA